MFGQLEDKWRPHPAALGAKDPSLVARGFARKDLCVPNLSLLVLLEP